MSREAFTPHIPSSSLQNQTSNPAAATSSSTAITTGSGAQAGTDGAFNENISKPVHYLCGDCDSKVTLKRGDPIRCKECGYRVLYKGRTNRMIQFEAR
ncbi:hypothetical protein MBLNU230_g6571t1 [Neophaeotheca triangularis]